MADNPKLDMAASSCEAYGLKENTSAEKISLMDHINGLQYNAAKKSDNFVIEMETFPHGVCKDISANSRTALQRALSKKGSLRGAAAEKKTNSIANDRDTIAATASPRGPSTHDKLMAATVGSADHPSSPHVHHQITITTGNIITTPDIRGILKRNSFKRSSWVLDPKRVLCFFATLSCVGTILLIYFTLLLKHNAGKNNID